MAFSANAADPLLPGGFIANAIAADDAGIALLEGYFDDTVDFVFATGMMIGPPEVGGIADLDEGPGTAPVLVFARQTEMFLARHDADGGSTRCPARWARGAMGEDLTAVACNDIAVAGRFQGPSRLMSASP